MSWATAMQLAFSGISVGSIYALVALALVIPFKASGVLNFGQGELVTLGAYTGLVFAQLELPYPLIVIGTVTVAALAGMAIERVLIRPIIHAPEFTLVIATFAIGIVIRALIRLHWQDNTFEFDPPYAGPTLRFAGVRLNPAFLVIIGCTLALVAGLAMFFEYTKLGRAMRAVASNQVAARLMGVRVGRVFSSAWALAGGIGALAGLLLAPVIGINPEMGDLILKALVAAVIGGFTSLGGAVVGGMLLGLLETFAGAEFGATFKNIVPFAVLISILLLRPHGLFGRAAAHRV
jgi:branched-chain amino acid transport system permease protein